MLEARPILPDNSPYQSLSLRSEGQSVLSLILPVQMPTPSAPSSAWPFGALNGIEGIVSAVERGVDGVKLGDWRAPQGSSAMK